MGAGEGAGAVCRDIEGCGIDTVGASIVAAPAF